MCSSVTITYSFPTAWSWKVQMPHQSAGVPSEEASVQFRSVETGMKSSEPLPVGRVPPNKELFGDDLRNLPIGLYYSLPLRIYYN